MAALKRRFCKGNEAPQTWKAAARPAIGGGRFGSCRSVEDFELLACIGEGTYGELFPNAYTAHRDACNGPWRLLPFRARDYLHAAVSSLVD